MASSWDLDEVAGNALLNIRALDKAHISDHNLKSGLARTVVISKILSSSQGNQCLPKDVGVPAQNRVSAAST